MIELISSSGVLSYLVLFVALAIGGVGLSAGEEVMLLLVGHLVYQGVFFLPLALLVSIGGVIAADNIGFHVGRHGVRWFPRLMAKIRSRRLHERLKDGRFIFLSRFVPHVRGLFPIAAGLHGIRWRHFVRWNMLGAVVFVPVVVLSGMFVGPYVFYVIGAVAFVFFVVLGVRSIRSRAKAE